MKMLWARLFGFLTVLISSVISKPEAMQCAPCVPSSCEAIGDCSRGITWDVCRCCEVCAKTVGEECGGPWNAYGKCGYGLTCVKDSRECPYLFTPRGSAKTNICDDYLFNAIGRCVEEENMIIRALKRKVDHHEPAGGPHGLMSLNLEGVPHDENGAHKGGKRLMLKGVLRGIEY